MAFPVSFFIAHLWVLTVFQFSVGSYCSHGIIKQHAEHQWAWVGGSHLPMVVVIQGTRWDGRQCRIRSRECGIGYYAGWWPSLLGSKENTNLGFLHLASQDSLALMGWSWSTTMVSPRSASLSEGDDQNQPQSAARTASARRLPPAPQSPSLSSSFLRHLENMHS